LAKDPSQVYLAGMWESSLIAHLAWYVDEKSSSAIEQLDGPSWSWTPVNHLVSLDCPSWSWISVDHKVRLDGPKKGNVDVEILSCNTWPLVATAPLGAVSGGQLVLKGYLAWHSQRNFMELRSRHRRILKRFSRNLSSQKPNLVADEGTVMGLPERAEGNELGTTEMFSLLFLGYSHHKSVYEIGLILRPNLDGTFVRIGTCEIHTGERALLWPEGLERQVVTIV